MPKVLAWILLTAREKFCWWPKAIVLDRLMWWTPYPRMRFQVPPHLLTECVIQATFFHFSILSGLNCTLELGTPLGRIDIAIFNQDWTRVLAVIECKHNSTKEVRETSQIRRYKRLGVPVFGLADIRRCERLCAQLKRDLTNNGGRPYQEIMEIPREPRWRKRQIEPDECLNYKY